MNTKLLETKRLILRKFVEEDASAMFLNWASNPNVTKYLSWPTHEDIDTTKMVLNSWIKDYDNGSFNWAIVLKEINEPIGNISVVNFDKEKNIIEIGYVIGEKYWNKGYTTEALKEVLKYLSSLGFNEIIAKHDTKNKASGRVMKKAGMSFSHFEEKSTKNNTGIVDCNVYKYKR